jgi:hypothetical protein
MSWFTGKVHHALANQRTIPGMPTVRETPVAAFRFCPGFTDKTGIPPIFMIANWSLPATVNMRKRDDSLKFTLRWGNRP